MVEIDDYMTIEFWKNGVLLESYSSKSRLDIERMGEVFAKKARPKFDSDGNAGNDKYVIHYFTY